MSTQPRARTKIVPQTAHCPPIPLSPIRTLRSITQRISPEFRSHYPSGRVPAQDSTYSNSFPLVHLRPLLVTTMAFHVLRLSPPTPPSPVPGPNLMRIRIFQQPCSPSSSPPLTSVPHPQTDRASLGCLTSLHLASTMSTYSFQAVQTSRTVPCAHLSKFRCSLAADRPLR